MESKSNKNTNIHFRSLDESHFPLMHKWFNQPHVQAFYSLKFWTLEEVHKKLMPHLRDEKKIQSFIIYVGEIPIGYIQSCSIKEYPWENQDLPENIVQQAAGFDLFIGEEEQLRKGFGSQIIDRFLEKYIWPHYLYCMVDPDIRNEASLRLFQKCGFKQHKRIDTKDALKREVTLQLFIKER